MRQLVHRKTCLRPSLCTRCLIILMKMTELGACRSFTLSSVCGSPSENLERLSLLAELEMTRLRDRCTARAPFLWLTSRLPPIARQEVCKEVLLNATPAPDGREVFLSPLVFKSERFFFFLTSMKPVLATRSHLISAARGLLQAQTQLFSKVTQKLME